MTTTTTFRRRLLAPALLALAGLLTACPYQSKVPLDTTPSVKVEASLLGRWEDREYKDYTYTVTKESSTLYKVIKIDNDRPKDTGEGYFGFVSKVDDDLFLNVYNSSEATSEDKTYRLFKLERDSKDRMRLLELSDGIDEKFTTAAELRAFVAKHKGLSFFYNQEYREALRKIK